MKSAVKLKREDLIRYRPYKFGYITLSRNIILIRNGEGCNKLELESMSRKIEIYPIIPDLSAKS